MNVLLGLIVSMVVACGHMVKDCPNVRIKDKGSSQIQQNSVRSEALKKNHFYVLKASGEQENSSNVVTGML